MKMFNLDIEKTELENIVNEKGTIFVKEQINRYCQKQVLSTNWSRNNVKYITLRFVDDIEFYKLKQKAIKKNILLRDFLKSIVLGKDKENKYANYK